MLVIARDFLLNLAAGVVGELSSPSGMMSYIVGLGLLMYGILGWHHKRIAKGKRGMDSWYVIALLLVVACAAIGTAGYGIGLRSTAVAAATVSTTKGLVENTPTVAASTPQLARLRVHYTSLSPSPEIIEIDNVLKPISFQFVDGGAQQDQKSGRNSKWTILILTFDKPVTGENVRVLFEGGDVAYERKNFTSRNVSFIFEGSVADKTIQIEVRP
jgi:hypothetical protein